MNQLTDHLQKNILAAAKAVTEDEAPSKNYDIMELTQAQQAAWAMFGTMSFIQSMYWCQEFYYKYHTYRARDWASSGLTDSSYGVNWYSWWSWGLTIYTMANAFVAGVSFFLWLHSGIFGWALCWFVKWNGLALLLHAFKWFITFFFKMMGIWGDSSTDYGTVNEWINASSSTTMMISKRHQLQFWDVLMDWGQAMISLTQFHGLYSIVEEEDKEEKEE